MKKSKKIIMLITLITGILLTSTGITYSIFLISKTSKNSNLVVGDIYMHYNETNQISLSNVMPSNTYTNDYFEFIIDGKNTTTDKDIWYEIVLNHGDSHETRTEKIKDSLLMFRLTEVNDNIETEIFTNKSFNNLENKRIYVNTINKNTTSVVVHTYRLYIWVSNKTKIGNIEDVDYDTNTWNNQVYGSIKVNVSGDFLEKYITPEASCFECEDNETGVSITNYNATCGSKIAIPDTINNKKVTRIKSNAFKNKKLEFVSIPSTVITIDSNAFTNNKIENITIPDTVSNLNCKAFDETVISNRDMTCTKTAEACFTVGTINDEEVAILDYDASCGTDVIIPSTVKGYKVTVIGSSDTSYIKKLSNQKNKQNIKFLAGEPGGGVVGSFGDKELTSIEIPDSVTTIEYHAFWNNQLTNVIIGNGIQYIAVGTFSKSSSSNPDLLSITINKTCSEIKNIQASSTNTNKYYPWLSYSSPYTAIGITIYGSNNEICDIY